MKTDEINEKKNAENQGVHFQNYSYLSCKMPYSAKPDFNLML